MIQIESLQGIRNLDDILTEVPDIDIVWLGTLDARVSMNLPVNAHGPRDEPEWLEAEELFHATLKKHRKPFSGFSFTSGEALRKATEGMAIAFVAADVLKLSEMNSQLMEARKAIAL